MAQKPLYIVTFRNAAEMENCPPSLIDRLRGMGDKVAFPGYYAEIADDEQLFSVATAINRAIREDKAIVVFGCLADDVQRITPLLDTRKYRPQAFTFAQVRLLLGM